MYDHLLHRGRKHFCRYCFQDFIIEKLLKCHIKVCFKINSKKKIKIRKRFKSFKSFGREIKSPFMIYADFESILVPGDNGKQNPNESYNNKYQKHIACTYS